MAKVVCYRMSTNSWLQNGSLQNSQMKFPALKPNLEPHNHLIFIYSIYGNSIFQLHKIMHNAIPITSNCHM